MTATVDRTDDGGETGSEQVGPDRAQLLVCAVLLVVGVFLIVDALSLTAEFAKVDPVGPKLIPIVVGIGMLVCSVLLAVATLRGSRGEQDGGEDIDTSTPADWKTVGLLVGLFVVTIVLVDTLGWVIIGAVLFGGAATILGNRHWIRNLAIGLVLSLLSFYAFYVGLGIPLPAGILDGIL
ncbi:tripartite tricarboxylate transporter TctB family protein [Rhodococcoides yunnanense]|uniref:Tripartite tricarboxylate transporter TctB family protein n=1 Tax=Rhodococcoides yunnanense TaxID=278209 RepID=A0ABU4B888_9NOCA|nr:tripartite tricarboxylate transporter TctB family protein [Rhodococcus yunnanensis]MDV6260410.1 tripartite tricarboxylate transporter TctB family protein [Rhodococcus yunnanensis]